DRRCCNSTMEHLVWYASGAALTAALLTYLLIAPVTRLAIALRALDQPSTRKLQTAAVPRLGGVAIVGSLGAAAGIAALLQWHSWGTAIAGREILALSAGTLLVFAVGVIDDLVGVGAGKKFAVELVAASLLISAGWSFHVLRLPFLGGIDLGGLS